MESNIAYCIPTYNHPEVIADVLGKCISLYKKYNIDIYVYDSSTDGRTGEIVKEFIGQGGNNLYYLRIDPSIGIDDKVLMILSGYGLKKEYKYIWPVKDRNYIKEHTIKIISETVNKNYDVIFLELIRRSESNKKNSEQEFYDDPVEFYGEWGWLATSLDATIFRVETLLKSMDWQELKKDYFFNGENAFDHFTVLFHSLAQLERCSVKIICHEDIDSYTSPLGSSSWRMRTFHIWTYLWMRVNKALPSNYDKYKSKVIKNATTLPWILGSYDKLMELKMSGILTSDVYEQICSGWELFSNISKEELKLIVSGQYQKVHDIVVDKMKRLLQSGDYLAVYDLYKYNSQIVKNCGGKREFALIADFLVIFREEMSFDMQKCIFMGTPDYGSLEQRYMILKYMLRRIEYGIAENSWKEVGQFIKENNISNAFIAYLVNKTCIKKEQTVERLVNVWIG